MCNSPLLTSYMVDDSYSRVVCGAMNSRGSSCGRSGKGGRSIELQLRASFVMILGCSLPEGRPTGRDLVSQVFIAPTLLPLIGSGLFTVGGLSPGELVSYYTG